MLTGGLNRLLDPRKLAQKQAKLSGQISASELVRFSNAVVGDFEPVRYSLNFELDHERRPIMQGELEADVQLECQRCLAPVSHNLHVEVLLRPVLTDAQAVAHQKDVDVVMLDEEGLLDAVHSMEDELLLNLPIVIYHEQSDCIASMEFAGDEVIPEESVVDTEENPFSILAQLKGAGKEE